MANNIKMRVQAEVIAASLKKTKEDIETAVKSGFDSAKKISKNAAENAKKAFVDNFNIEDAIKNAKIKLKQFSKILGDSVSTEFAKGLSAIETQPIGIGQKQTLKSWNTELKNAVVTNKEVIEAEKEALRLQMAQQKAAISMNNLRGKNLNSLKNISIKLDEIRNKVTNKELNNLKKTFSNVKNISDEVEKSKAISKLNIDIKNAVVNSRSFSKEMANNIKKFAMWTTASTIIMKAVQSFKKMLDTVIQLDKAFTSIQMVTGYTTEQIQSLKQEYNDLAKELKISVVELANAADEWLRMGYNATEATNALTASVKFAKVALLDTSSATKYLISAMKGYKLEVEDLTSISDMLNKVDMAAAVSAADLAEGMSEVASMAKLSGIEMSTLLGYLAAVGEVTQTSGSETGTALKSILSRMTKVAAGVETDEEGEDLNEVAIVLRRLGISMVDTTGKMRNMQEVLSEVAGAYQYLTTTEKNQLTTALGGTRMREKATVLLENYAHAMDLADEAANSFGTTEEKYAVYTEGIDAKMQNLTATFQKLAQTTVEGGLFKSLVDIGSALLGISNYTGGLVPSVLSLVGLLQIIKQFSIASEAKKVATSIDATVTATERATAATTAFKASIGGIISIVTLAIGVIMGIVGAIKSYREEQEKQRIEAIKSAQNVQESVLELKKSYIDLYKNINDVENADEKIGQSWKNLTELANKYGLEIGNINNSYEDYLSLANKVEQAALKEETALTRQDMEEAKNKLKNKQKLTFSSLAGFSGAFKYGSDLSKYLPEYTRKNKYTTEEIINLLTKATSDMYSEAIKTGYDITSNELYVEMISMVKNYREQLESATKVITEYEYKELKSKYLASMSNIYDKSLGIFKEFENLSLKDQKNKAREELNILKSNIDNIKLEYADLSDYIDEQYANIIKGYQDIIDKNATELSIKNQISIVKELQSEFETENELLEKQAKLQEKILSVQEAQKKLTEAKKKTISVYREGKGFIQEADLGEVQTAQSALIEAQDELANYKKEISFETEIDQLNSLSEAYNMLFETDSGFKNFINTQKQGLIELGDTTEEVMSTVSNAVKEYFASLAAIGVTNADEYIDKLGITNETQQESIRKAFGSFQTKHSGGVVGASGSVYTSGNLKANEVLTKLQKGEFVLNKQGQENVLKALYSQNNGENVTYNIGNVELPNVSNAKQFINELKALGRTSLQNVKRYV